MKVTNTKAAILAQSREPLIIDTIDMPDKLDFGQVLVEIDYTTVCGTQINEIAAKKGVDRWLPHLLGNEGVGTVIETGPGVSTANTGDTVILHWRPGAGIQANPASYSWQGKKLNAGWVTTFNRHAVISENRVTPISEDYDHKVAPLLGCAVTTAAGVINNDAKVKIGESVVIFGIGGVGVNLVQFANMVSAYPIVAVDLVDSKLEMAKKYGASHTINNSNLSNEELANQVRDIVGNNGVDKMIESTGVTSLIELAYELTHADGTCVLVGVPSEKVSLYTLPLHFNKILTGSHGGDATPAVDIPRIVRLAQAGKLSFDGIITHEMGLDQINEGLDIVRTGSAGRVLINMTDI